MNLKKQRNAERLQESRNSKTVCTFITVIESTLRADMDLQEKKAKKDHDGRWKD